MNVRFIKIAKNVASLVFVIGVFGLLWGPSLGSVLALEPAPAPSCSPVGWMCANVTDLDVGHTGPHRQRLTASNLPSINPVTKGPIQTYIVCGVDSPDGMLFTTGNAQADQQLCLGKDTLSIMKRDYQYSLSFLNTSNPFVSTDGNADVTVLPGSEQLKNHSCYFAWQIPPEVVSSQQGSDRSPESTNVSTLVYSTFRVQSGQAQCSASVRADPFGRVFNENLRPVPGASLSIFDYAAKQLMSIPGLRNPVTTLEDGIFNFNIPPGTSYINGNLRNNPNPLAQAAKAYSNLYKYGDPIVETAEKAEQRDIPVLGGQKPVLKLMGYSEIQLGRETRIEGLASWPLTLVTLEQGGQTIGDRNADTYGAFSFNIGNSFINAELPITITLIAVDLTKDTPVSGDRPESITQDVLPIPRYLDGIAYDKKGTPMPFATVKIRLERTNDTYFKTSADAKGYFTVSPRNLPILPYYLEFVPSNTVRPENIIDKTPITQFAIQNRQYLQDNAIQLVAGIKNGTYLEPEITPAPTKTLASDTQNGTGANDGTLLNKQKGALSQTGMTGLRLIFFAFILVFIIMTIVGSFTMYRQLKKRLDERMTL